MNLLLLRHADAAFGGPDLARPLTSKGEEQARIMGDWLRQHAPRDLRILVSPALRTQQTARAFTENFTTESSIGPGASPQQLLNAAGWPEHGGSVLVVGHQPTMGRTASLLLRGEEEDMDYEKAGLWWFEYRENDDQPETVLRLATHPGHLGFLEQ